MTSDPYADALQQEARIDQLTQEIQTEARHLANINARRAEVIDRCAQLARKAHDAGMPETHIARTMHVNRRTVRRWLGKPE